MKIDTHIFLLIIACMKPYQLVNKDIWNEAINVKVLPIDQYGIASIKAWFIES